MGWLEPAIIATLSNTSILAAVYLYLYMKEKHNSLLLFFISWSVYSLRYIAMLFFITTNLPVFLVVNQITVIVSSHLMVIAFNSWQKKKTSEIVLTILSSLCLVWVIGIGLFRLPFTVYTIPVYFYIGGLYIYTAIKLFGSPFYAMSGIKIVSITLLIWGLHKLDYPFLRPVEWFAPWGYLLGALAAVITAIGMILIYFETTKEQLKSLLSEKEILISEINHRVKNNLSILHALVKHNSDSEDNPNLKEVLKKLETKVFAFALIHSFLHKSDSVEKIDFKQYLKELTSHLIQTYGESDNILSVQIELDELFIDITKQRIWG